MATQQSGAIVNLVLFFALGCGGWFLAAGLKKPAEQRVAAGTVNISGPANQPGVFAGDAARIAASSHPGAEEFDELASRYGSGSRDLALLALPLLEKWIARDPAGAAEKGVARVLAHAPDILPQLFRWLGAVESLPVAPLLAAIPPGPLRADGLSALAAARGSSGLDAGLSATLSRSERSLVLREWHRARATAVPAAAETSARALTDPDDREAALSGTLLARAAADPALVLTSSSARQDFPAIAKAAFEAWIPRNTSAAWAFAATLKGDKRLPEIAAHMILVESRRRLLSEALPEMTALLERLFPDGLPDAPLTAFIPALASENPASAQKFCDSLPVGVRSRSIVLLFDALCPRDPSAAWRVAAAEAQKDSTKDRRTTHTWKSAAARAHASPQQRVEAGFPDFADMTQLALAWLESDPAAAIAACCAPGTPSEVQKLFLECAVSADGAFISPAELLAWADKSRQPEQVVSAIERLQPKKPAVGK